MQGAGSALMGIGSARGADRAIKAAELAVASPLLEASIEGAHGVLLSIQGSSNLALSEITEASQLVHDVVHSEANIIFGTVIDDTLGDEVRVTVIAAGFDPEQLDANTGRVPERGRFASRVETIDDLPAATRSRAQSGESAENAAEFGEVIVSPPVEEQLVDPAFDGEDLDLDIPDFLK